MPAGLPSPTRVQEEAAESLAAKLAAKGKPFDMDELIRMEPDRGVTNVRKLNISGNADVQMSVRAMKAGAIEFLTKPVRHQDLLSAVDMAVNAL
jgi:FixJ family two-component response regulator